jgi:hypothetical protein
MRFPGEIPTVSREKMLFGGRQLARFRHSFGYDRGMRVRKLAMGAAALACGISCRAAAAQTDPGVELVLPTGRALRVMVTAGDRSPSVPPAGAPPGDDV